MFSAADLRQSEKDRAENVMIVDLLRNDLSRVCDPSSVQVTQLCELGEYQFVQHLVSAVEYVQANRLRTLIMAGMEDLFTEVDVYLTPSWEGDSLLLTNLTGHPQVVVPCGLRADHTPFSLSFVGRLYDEATLLAVAKVYQDATDWHRRHPRDFRR